VAVSALAVFQSECFFLHRQDSPTAAEAEKIAYVNDETTPSLRRRIVGALMGGEAAIEEFLDNSYVNVGKASS